MDVTFFFSSFHINGEADNDETPGRDWGASPVSGIKKKAIHKENETLRDATAPAVCLK